MMHGARDSAENLRRDTAGVIAPPPLLYGAVLIVALALHALYPLPIAPGSRMILWIAGAVAIMAGLALIVGVVHAFTTANTPISPFRQTTRLVSTGPYRYSRNPAYLGQTLIYAGIAVIADSWWPIVVLPLLLAVVQHGIIRREERYLEAKFGDEYRGYSTRVRRWL
jgi:protein-S-isoprenylcysteine O-methyltransferase Ste14